jgi:glycosyltransferase involved in cell wall biosynthesis
MESKCRDRRSAVSAVIPAFNSGKTLAEALESVLSQSAPPLEVIVVNDGSTDDTAAVLKRFSGKVKVITQSNAGLAAARRAGIAHAMGDLVALFDADDICEPDRLAVQAAYMDSRPEVLLCCTDFSAFDSDGPVAGSFSQTYYGAIGRQPGGLAGIFPIHEEFPFPASLRDAGPAQTMRTYRGSVYDKLVLGNFVHPPTIMFRRDILKDVENFDPRAGSMCDWDWIMQVARHGQIGYIAQPLLRYRLSPSQMSAERFRYRRAIDTLLILQRLERRDPQVYQRFKRELDAKRAIYCLDAADAICEENRMRSIGWLFQGAVVRKQVTGRSFRILAKTLLPSQMRQVIRQLRD